MWGVTPAQLIGWDHEAAGGREQGTRELLDNLGAELLSLPAIAPQDCSTTCEPLIFPATQSCSEDSARSAPS